MKGMRISIEEMAYGIGLLSGGEQGGIFLKSILGEREPKEIEGRLLAAAHSLIARGWLTLQDEQLALQDELLFPLRRILESKYIVRLSKTQQGEEQIVTFSFGPNYIVEHRTEQAVVSVIEEVTWEQFLTRCMAFFEIETHAASPHPGEELGVFPAEILDAVRRDAETGNLQQARKKLAERGVPGPIAREITEDMASPTWRGSVMKVLAGPTPVGEKGFLLLKGTQRIWLLLIDENAAQIQILDGDPDKFIQILTEISQ